MLRVLIIKTIRGGGAAGPGGGGYQSTDERDGFKKHCRRHNGPKGRFRELQLQVAIVVLLVLPFQKRRTIIFLQF